MSKPSKQLCKSTRTPTARTTIQTKACPTTKRRLRLQKGRSSTKGRCRQKRSVPATTASRASRAPCTSTAHKPTACWRRRPKSTQSGTTPTPWSCTRHCCNTGLRTRRPARATRCSSASSTTTWSGSTTTWSRGTCCSPSSRRRPAET